MKGYKAFNSDMTCRGFQYEIGRRYKTDNEISICSHGFHFCKNIIDCLDYYSIHDSVFCEVESYGKTITDGNKTVASDIKIIRGITLNELNSLFIESLFKNNSKNNNTSVIFSTVG